ncbi:hypothetical protein [Leisingera sp. S232]|uniref:hypothetical protein n=1 Tax=Leisingera sp. S232 TaxID=3415132 RepID=UPI003C7CFAF2
MTVARMSARPSEFVAPEQFQALTGMNNPMLADAMWQTAVLRLSIDDFLRESLLPLPSLPSDVAGIYEKIAFSSQEELMSLARVLSVLINFAAVVATTDSKRLNAVVEWCGNAGLLDLLRNRKLPEFKSFPVLSSLSIDMLELYASHILVHLIGVLPEGYRQRLLLRYPPGTYSAERAFADDDPDRLVFDKYLQLAVPLWPSAGERHAQD